MDSLERWRRAGVYATRAGDLRVAVIAFVVSVVVLAGLTLFWFWILKLRDL